ncbi:MAG TPA: alkaline phosphatase [Hyphomonadaceae bacterium]|jgi:alkaline phosphatase|nr:alkaline phosphatase [Hyphomonadaceae bacterium]
MFRTLLLASAAAFATSCTTMAGPLPNAVAPVQASDSYYVSAHAAVAKRAAERGSEHAKNVILFIGDGMGIATVTAARIYSGQAKGVDGESYKLAMEQLPYSAFSKTYTHDSQVADSAPTATAMTTGVKSYNGTLGITQHANIKDCASAKANATDTLWEIAEDAGLATGVVTTARFTHATPAATYTKTTERDWEDDTNISPEGKAKGCTDIATSFLNWPHGDGMEVALGGGRAQFLPNTMTDPEYANQKGDRSDGRNMMDEWKSKRPDRVTVTDKAGFEAFDWNGSGQILGLFEPSHMQYDLDRNAQKEPSLADMTTHAIRRLSKNPKGYILMVEGGRVDHGLHAGNAARALGDAKALDEAVAAAVAMAGKDTLIIVTADHSHTLMIQGYPDRGNPILGLVKEGGKLTLGQDGKPYTTLSFANGPGSVCKKQPDNKYLCDRADLTNVDTGAKDFLQQSLTPLGSETHGGEDVAIFAGGPGANLFSGAVEQNEIFHVMARSLGLVK